MDKVIKYALVHDLVEVYAGDTYVYTKNQDELDSKEDREKEAADRLGLYIEVYGPETHVTDIVRMALEK